MTEPPMAGCTHPSCFDPDSVGCNMGDNLAECPHRKKWLTQQRSQAGSEDGDAGAEAADADGKHSERHLRLPWTGRALGARDLDVVTASNRTCLLGVVGPFNSGKTTLLSMMYLLMARGEQLPDWRFAASTTLTGWGALADNLRWSDVPPKFPEHTSRGTGRTPGLLHLAVRGVDQLRRDYLLTDPPGEWFSDWATKGDHEGAEGARWIARYAARFLFLIDREALAGPGRGGARDGYRELARRLADARRDRPIAVVWTKTDKDVSPKIEAALKECFAQELPGHHEFNVRVRFGNEERGDVEAAWLALMKWAFAPQPLAGPESVREWREDTQDHFLNYRGQGMSRERD